MKLKIFHIILVRIIMILIMTFSLELEDSYENNFSTDDPGDDKLNSITNEIKCSCLFFVLFSFFLFVFAFLSVLFFFSFCFSLEVEKCSRSRAT